MSIKMNDILFAGDMVITECIADGLKQDLNVSPLTFGKIIEVSEKYKQRNSSRTELNRDEALALVGSCICSYHDQLRSELLKHGIDIGEIEFEDEEQVSG